MQWCPGKRRKNCPTNNELTKLAINSDALSRHPAFFPKVVVERPRIQSALAVLAELHQFESPTSPQVVLATGFDPLDEVLAGGIRPGEMLLVGGKPGVGKTIATRQWARSMAQRGGVAVYLCFEHDQVTMLTRLLSCELGEVIAIHPARTSRVERVELQGRIRDVAAGAITLQQALDSDPLIDEAHRRLAAYADRLVFVTGSGEYPNVNAIGEITQRFEGQRSPCSSTTSRRCLTCPLVPTRASESDEPSRG